jgi:predicted PurR-regulated permease PerM
LVWEFRSAVGLFLLSLTVAAAVRPLVDRLIARGLSPGLAVVSVSGVCVFSIVGVILLLSGTFFAELQQLATDLAGSYENLRSQWSNGTLFQQVIAQQLLMPNDLVGTIMGQSGSALLQTFLGVTLGSFDLLGQLIIVLVLSIYWSVDQERFKRLWLSLFPSEVRARAREIWQNVESDVGAYIRSEFIQSLLAIFLLSAGYHLIGLKYPVVLGVIGAIGWLIPWVGVMLAVIPALLVGLAMSPTLGIGAALLTLAVLSLLEFVVEPRFFNRRRFSSLLVVIVVLVLVDPFGLLGFVLAPPLAAVIQILAGQLIRSTTMATAITQPLGKVDILEERLKSVQTLIAQQAEPPALEIINLIDRLTQLVERAKQEERLTNERDGPPSDFRATAIT